MERINTKSYCPSDWDKISKQLYKLNVLGVNKNAWYVKCAHGTSNYESYYDEDIFLEQVASRLPSRPRWRHHGIKKHF